MRSIKAYRPWPVTPPAGRPAFPCGRCPAGRRMLETLKRWFRQFVEVRDADGAERCIVSAVQGGAAPATVADMLFAAVTDHRYIDVGHPLDFTNKAFEALDASRLGRRRRRC